MELVLKKNEAEINESVAKGLLMIFSCVFLIVLLCWIGIFDVRMSMTFLIFGISVITNHSVRSVTEMSAICSLLFADTVYDRAI